MNDIQTLFNRCIDQILDIQNRAKKGRRTLGSRSSDAIINEHLKDFEALKMLKLDQLTLSQLRDHIRWKVQFKPGLAPFCNRGHYDFAKLDAVNLLISLL